VNVIYLETTLKFKIEVDSRLPNVYEES